MNEKKKSLLDQLSSQLIVIAVVLMIVVIPASLWIAQRFFGWEPPEFLRSFFGG